MDLNGRLIYTEDLAGQERAWGVCLDCGHIDELTDKQAMHWERRCSACEQEYIGRTARAPGQFLRVNGVPDVGAFFFGAW